MTPYPVTSERGGRWRRSSAPHLVGLFHAKGINLLVGVWNAAPYPFFFQLRNKVEAHDNSQERRVTAHISAPWNWRRAVANSELPATTKHCLLTLSLYASEAGGGVFPSVGTLARQTSLTRKTVIAHLTAAAESGWIEKSTRAAQNGRQKSNLYHLTDPSQGEGAVKAPPTRLTTPSGGRLNHPLVSLNGVSLNPTTLSSERGLDLGDTDTRDATFEAIWALDRRGKKQKARKQYMKAVPSRVSATEIHAARAELNRVRGNRAFVEHLDTWCRDDGWLEELEAADGEENGPAIGSDDWMAAEEARIGGDG